MKKIIFLILLGLILRLLLSIQFYSGDVNNHISWAKDLLFNGSYGIYEREFYFRYGTLTPNYPPLALLLFSISYGLYELIYNVCLWANTHISVFPSQIIWFLQGLNIIPAFLKLPAIFADIGIAWITYLFAKKLKQKETWSLLAASLVLFNPAFFYNSASWGQVDALPIFFSLSSFYLLIYSKKPLLASLVFTLGVLSKQNIAILVPIYILASLQIYSPKKLIKPFIASIVIFWLSFVPFYGVNFVAPFTTYWTKILTNSVSDYVTYHAFNFWTLFVGLNKVHDSNLFLFGLSYQLSGYILFGSVLIVTLGFLWKKKSQYNIIYSSAIISFASFLFLTRLHERHLEPTLPLLLLIGIKEKKLLPIFIFASIFYVLNLYHDWWAPRIPSIVAVMSNLDVIKTLVFGLLITFAILLGNFSKIKKSQD